MTRLGSLRGRLLRRLALPLSLILLASSLSAYWSARHAADTAYDRTLLASARAISDGLYSADGGLQANVPYMALDAFAYDSAGRIYYQVLGFDGGLVSGYEDLPAAPPDTPRTEDYPALARFYDGVYRGQGVRVVSLLQPVSELTLQGVAEIRVAETQGARERMARELLIGTLWRIGLLVVVALLLIWVAVSLALRPLETLRRAVAERASDDLRPLPDAELPREIGPLVEALNQFNERLQTLFERQSAFIADAAHELRTPWLRSRRELPWACAPSAPGLAPDAGAGRRAERSIDHPGQSVAVTGAYREWCAGHHRGWGAAHRSQSAGSRARPGHGATGSCARCRTGTRSRAAGLGRW